jgi:hypothetical protein
MAPAQQDPTPDALEHLERQVSAELASWRAWYARIAPLLRSVGYEPQVRLWGREYEHLSTLPEPRRVVRTPGEWDQFLRDGTVAEYREAEHQVRALWVTAQNRGLVPELPPLDRAEEVFAEVEESPSGAEASGQGRRERLRAKQRQRVDDAIKLRKEENLTAEEIAERLRLRSVDTLNKSFDDLGVARPWS